LITRFLLDISGMGMDWLLLLERTNLTIEFDLVAKLVNRLGGLLYPCKV
jgi:hypothetical protein